MYIKDTDLASKICSRICHDLASPIGAINNGLELMELSGEPETPEFSLVQESVRNANARIRFFRIVFGAAAPGLILAKSEISEVIKEYFTAPSLSVYWHLDEDLDRRDAKLALLLIMCMTSSLPYGGEIHVHKTGESWMIKAKGRTPNLEPRCWSRLTEDSVEGELPPAQIQFELAGALCRSAGIWPRIAGRDDAITLVFSTPLENP